MIYEQILMKKGNSDPVTGTGNFYWTCWNVGAVFL